MRHILNSAIFPWYIIYDFWYLEVMAYWQERHVCTPNTVQCTVIVHFYKRQNTWKFLAIYSTVYAEETLTQKSDNKKHRKYRHSTYCKWRVQYSISSRCYGLDTFFLPPHISTAVHSWQNGQNMVFYCVYSFSYPSAMKKYHKLRSRLFKPCLLFKGQSYSVREFYFEFIFEKI